ncbi:MAG: iron-sulfur cluster assembly accessory protein [Candidatus Bipolaricaulota bacterium]|nr:iron-sulfur cluster assembly accessory protein [Candidatus Bipolaricaulota bacterium]MDW8030471.1 iron-sulfur cluster assembly accessory protein [Candidatus Bipolaricaulota bacterium]
MLTVTERAAQALYQFLQSEGKTDYALRIVAQLGGCSCCGPAYGLFLEKESAPGDTIIHAGPVKIFLDQMSSALLDEATLDFMDGPEQGFFIDNPKAHAEGAGGCACGG